MNPNELRDQFNEYTDYLKKIRDDTYIGLDISTDLDRVKKLEEDFCAWVAYYFPDYVEVEIVDVGRKRITYDDLISMQQRFIEARWPLLCENPKEEDLINEILKKTSIEEYFNSPTIKTKKNEKTDFDRDSIIGNDRMWKGRITRAAKRRFAKEMRWLQQRR